MPGIDQRTDSFFEVTQPARGVVCTVARGRFLQRHAMQLMSRVDPLIATGIRPVIFHDWEALTGYDPESRERLVKWVMTMRTHIGGVHMLVGSRLIAMALSVANITMGGFIRGYTDRPAFEKERDRAIARAGG